MLPVPRSRWSVMRIVMLSASTALTLVLTATIVADLYYTSRIDLGVLTVILMRVAVICWVAYIAAHVRDTSIAHQALVERRIMAHIDAIAEQVADYGDRREIAGHVAANTVNGSRPRLSPVD